MIFKRIDHVGIVVNSLDESLKTYCDQLGFRILEQQILPEHKVEVAFLDAENGTLELLTPTDTVSGTAQFLQKRGEGTHHICFEVDDIEKTLSELRTQGTRLIDETPRQGVHGLVAFVHPKAAHGIMIELLQKNIH